MESYLRDYDKNVERIKRYFKTDRGREVNRKASEKSRKNGKAKEWQENNRDKLKEYGRHRRMNKTHEISKNEWENCKNYFNYRCAYCGLPVEEHQRLHYGEIRQFDLHKEHVDHNGANDLSNCVPACQSCNSSKSEKKLEDWYNKSNKKFTQERLNKIHKWIEEDYLRYKE